MKIIERLSERELDAVGIELTEDEARQLVYSVTSLITDPSNDHEHVSQDDYQVELTIWISGERKNTTLDGPVWRKIGTAYPIADE